MMVEVTGGGVAYRLTRATYGLSCLSCAGPDGRHRDPLEPDTTHCDLVCSDGIL